ncbi:MAG: sigma-54-dependent Fis family transcriptional regulator [Gemmatimonadetes bacterium]|jgi:two-component system, NtrC family, response regulator AtoC|nr:sigma-54-dependent Fis family transcriptional regulator [Gemmatimonadota bacterium]
MSAAQNQLRILLVDDDDDVRRTLGDYLRGRDHRVVLSGSGERGLEILQGEKVDIVITDMRMSGMDGFELLAAVREGWPGIEVIVITAYGDVEGAVRAMREGAFDYFTKPFEVHDIAASLQRTARFQSLRRENERFRERLDRLGAEGRRRYGLEAIIGESQVIGQVKELVAQVAGTEGTTVLLVGETGTGKELVARAIHYESARARGPFVAVDCSAVPQTLIENAFYGHVKGAFTDAREAGKGYFEMADGGTLFLDEIGDMDPAMQTRLLRTLEERRVRRLGGAEEIAVDVRVVSATNQDLLQATAEGRFRQDLFYRLNTFTIRIPPLRERPEDILPLARHFLERFGREMRKSIAGFGDRAQSLLAAHPFPGNVRELRNTVERAVILCREDRVGEAQLVFERAEGREEVSSAPAPVRQAEEGESLNLAEAEERLIRRALQSCAGNKAGAARLLGISRDALRRRVERYGIEERD